MLLMWIFEYCTHMLCFCRLLWKNLQLLSLRFPLCFVLYESPTDVNNVEETIKTLFCSSECTTKFGTSAGSCAQGFGVCCTCKFNLYLLNIGTQCSFKFYLLFDMYYIYSTTVPREVDSNRHLKFKWKFNPHTRFSAAGSSSSSCQMF
jgi:hypothetical protein